MTENFDPPDMPDEQDANESSPAECPRAEPDPTVGAGTSSIGGLPWESSTPNHPQHFPLGPPHSSPYGHPVPPPAPTHAPAPPFHSGPGVYGGPPPSYGSGHAYWGAPGAPAASGGHAQWGPPSWPPVGSGPWGGSTSPEPQKKSKARHAAGKPVVAVFLVACVALAGVVGALVGHSVWQSTKLGSLQSSASTLPSVGNGSSNGSNNSNSTPLGSAQAIASRVDPGLVDINTTLGYEQLEGAGTGMVLTSNGLVLTNNHVVEGATSISVTDIGNGKTYGATIVGYDRTKDVAVIQLTDASGLTTVTLASNSNVTSGEEVVAVGNAGGAGGTPSYAAGTVTATGQSITAEDDANGTSEQLTGLIETNADIVAGDSGGPLVNAEGQVLGMDTAAAQGFEFQSTGDQGYSIPISEAYGLATSIKSGDSSSTVHVGPTAFLGVEVESSSSSGTTGALIAELLPNGPAEQAGLLEGDTITSLGGTSVTSPEGLTNVILTKKPGDTVQVQYFDSSGNQHTTTLKLGSGPPQ
ncbi:MAG: trypsin-like peptidase domain-containing protein [Acidimicrobiales bacterium]